MLPNDGLVLCNQDFSAFDRLRKSAIALGLQPNWLIEKEPNKNRSENWEMKKIENKIWKKNSITRYKMAKIVQKKKIILTNQKKKS